MRQLAITLLLYTTMVAATLGGLAGCGQMGGLYHPSQEEPAQPPVNDTDATTDDAADPR